MGPLSNSCHISAIRRSSVTVSGPAKAIRLVKSSCHLEHKIHLQGIPLHAPALFSERDLVGLERTSPLEAAALDVLCCISNQFQLSTDLSEVVAESNVKVVTFSSGELTNEALGQLSNQHGRRIDVIDLAATECNGSTAPSKPDIAVVGMAGRFPEADDAEKFWLLLQAGRDVHRTIPSDRFNFETHYDQDGERKNTSKTPYGCFINRPGLFDSRFFNMSPKEAEQTDPAQRLTILTAYEALEMSGFVPNRTPSTREDRVGTFYGQASDDWRETNSSQDINTYFIPGGIRAFGPGRINYHLKFSGPSFSVDTACSSSFAAIHAACNALWVGDCDTAIAGAANILTNPDIFAGLSAGHFLSHTGSCKTFDMNADGYCRADGVGSIILKRLKDAESDKDNILGVILGIQTNHSAHAVSITHPHAPTQAALYQSLLANSSIDPYDIDYIEMHGTGTQAGDFHETSSISEVFGSSIRHRRQYPVYVGSAKANIGHAEAAAGIISIMKVLQMLRKSLIPPHVGIKETFNPSLPTDLEERGIRIPLSTVMWPQRNDSTPRTAFLNNFSAAGGNTSIILQERACEHDYRDDPRPAQVITITAKTVTSMQSNIKNLVRHIAEHPELRLADLSYTLTARRMAHSLRRSFAASTLEDARRQLLSCQDAAHEPYPTTIPGVIFVFTGQGALYPGLAKSLFDTCISFRKDILEYDSIAQSHGFPSFLKLITGHTPDLASLGVVITQVGQVVVQLALANLWQSWGIRAKAVIGHSLGEYPAFVIAGVMSASDMIYLVGRRAKMMDESSAAGSHGMVAVNEDASRVASELIASSVEVSCDNGPKMTVLGGPMEQLDDCASRLESKGLKCTKLPLPHAYHTSQVDPILAELRKAASRIQLHKPKVPIISSVLGRTVSPGSGDIDPEYICQHARSTVKFQTVLCGLKNHDEWTAGAIWLEVGPHPTCVKLVQRNLGPKVVIAESLNKDRNPWKTLSVTVCNLYDRGFNLLWEEFHRSFEGCHRLVELPAYAWDLRNFWIQYENDWALTKGNKLMKSIKESATVQSLLSTTSVQRVIEEDSSDGRASILCETDFLEPILRKKAAGHKVNGVALCSSSFYCDMAFTVADYLYRMLYPDSPAFDMNLHDLTIGKPFIVEECADIRFRISASITHAGSQVELYTIRASASQKTTHATCNITFVPVDKWVPKLQRNSYLVQSRIAALEQAASDGKAHRIQRKLVYKLFSNFVDYDEEFQGINELILHSLELEARAKVVLHPVESRAKFHTPPTWIDSLLHLTGAILNASDAIDTASFVYISEGLGSLRILDTLRDGRIYTTYTRMQNTEDNVMEGDVWIFDGDRVVGIAKRVKFQRIPRKVIDTLLPRRDRKDGPLLAASRGSGKTRRLSPESPKSALTKPKLNSIIPTVAVPLTEGDSPLFNEVLSVISTECGVGLSELVDGMPFTSLGIDSLLSLEILAKLREDLGLDLGAEVFIERQTIGGLRSHVIETAISTGVGSRSAESVVVQPSALIGSGRSSLQRSSNDSEDSLSNIRIDSERSRLTSSYDDADFELPLGGEKGRSSVVQSRKPKAASYLLSGNPKTAAKFLFLFPDGSGSASSYARMPPLGEDVVAFGLNCPYMTTPHEWTEGMDAVTNLYIQEIRRRKPTGPYNFAGWSAGGIFAYNAAWQLQSQGELVERLILIDSPCPLALPPMPVKMFKFLDTIGMLGSGGGTPDWVIPHFAATVRHLDNFTPASFAAGTEPRTTVIWARYGVLRESGGRRPRRELDDPAVMEWLLEDRTDFGCNGWDQLIPEHSIVSEIMDGHHFSMTKDNVRQIIAYVHALIDKHADMGHSYRSTSSVG